MEKNGTIELIKNLTKQIIYYEERTLADKIGDFISVEKGKDEEYIGIHKDQKAFLRIVWQALYKTVSFGVGIDASFIGKWKRLLKTGFDTKYRGIEINTVTKSQGHLVYTLGMMGEIPFEPDIEKIRNIYDNLYNLARRIETTEKSNVFATNQVKTNQLVELKLWEKLAI